MRGKNDLRDSAPALQAPGGERLPIRRLVGLGAALIVCAFVAVLLQSIAAPVVLILFTFLAMIGVAALFFAAAGFLQFGLRAASQSPDLTRLYAEHASRGMAFTSKDGSTCSPTPLTGR